MITEDTFRQSFPEFESKTEYPDSAINYQINAARLSLNSNFWGTGNATAISPPTTQLDMGTELYVAHNLVIEKKNSKASKKRGVPGENTGPVSSKSVGSVSVNYDTAAAVEQDAGHWNLTVYGTRFIKLARMLASVPLQVGVGCEPFGVGAWPGPWPWPAPGGSGFSS